MPTFNPNDPLSVTFYGHVTSVQGDPAIPHVGLGSPFSLTYTYSPLATTTPAGMSYDLPGTFSLGHINGTGNFNSIFLNNSFDAYGASSASGSLSQFSSVGVNLTDSSGQIFNEGATIYDALGALQQNQLNGNPLGLSEEFAITVAPGKILFGSVDAMNVQVVPEPSSAALVITGVAAAYAIKKKLGFGGASRAKASSAPAPENAPAPEPGA